MTTIKDYARDLVLATVTRLQEVNSEDIEILSDEEIDILVDDFISLIERIVG